MERTESVGERAFLGAYGPNYVPNSERIRARAVKLERSKCSAKE